MHFAVCTPLISNISLFVTRIVEITPRDKFCLLFQLKDIILMTLSGYGFPLSWLFSCLSFSTPSKRRKDRQLVYPHAKESQIPNEKQSCYYTRSFSPVFGGFRTKHVACPLTDFARDYALVQCVGLYATSTKYSTYTYSFTIELFKFQTTIIVNRCFRGN